MLNSEHEVLQLRIEGSRRGKGSREKWLPTLDPHVDGGNGKKAMVYNTKREKKEEDEEKEREKEKKKKEKTWVLLVIVLGHVRGYFLYRYMRITLSFEHYNPISLS